MTRILPRSNPEPAKPAENTHRTMGVKLRSYSLARMGSVVVAVVLSTGPLPSGATPTLQPLATQPPSDLDEVIRKVRTSHDARDAKDFLEWSRKLVALVPRSTRALSTLAAAHAMNGDAASAAALLDRLTKMGVATEARSDHDFDPIREAPAFQLALTNAQSLEKRIGSGQIAFRLEEKDLGLEGIAYDPRSRSFFVSSVRKRKVVRRTADGRTSNFTRSTDGLLAAVALGVDATHRRLWVTTAGSPEMEGFRKEDEALSFLVEYDLETGDLLRRIPPPSGLDRAVLSDLAVNADGDVFVADPMSGRVYALRQGASALVVLTDAGPIGSAQGLAPSVDGKFLFVADYVRGIVRVDQRTGAALLLPVPDDTATTGIDGLVLHGSDLIGVQNGFRPHRVVRLRMDDARERITAVDTLERNHPEFDEPTLGVVVDGAFYYVANSQAGRTKVDGGGATKVRSPAILRLPLNF
jgi:hypothetical protein